MSFKGRIEGKKEGTNERTNERTNEGKIKCGSEGRRRAYDRIGHGTTEYDGLGR